MDIEQQEIELRMQHFEEVCRSAGIKLTHQRIEIFREIAVSGDHPDAEQIFQRVRKRMPTVSLDTVYRNLWLLHDLGLISTLGSRRERTRFDANLKRHHHFICRKCGFTRDFYSNQLNAIDLSEAVSAFGEIGAIHVEIQGICQKCKQELGKPIETISENTKSDLE